MTTFEPGKTYTTRSICDHDCIIKLNVASRTAKTLTTIDGEKFRITWFAGVEQVKPWGAYSMAPIVGADDIQPI